MAKDAFRSASAQHIAREYQRAKKLGITQKEFVKATGISSDRYLRKILAGERSGRIIEQRATRGGVFNIRSIAKMPDGSEVAVSKNVRIPFGTSRLDIFKPKVQRAIKTEIVKRPIREELNAQYAGILQKFRYNMKQTKFIPDREVRAMPTVVTVPSRKGRAA